MSMHWGYRRGGAADPMDACPYPPSLISLVHTSLPTASTCISLPDSFLCPQESILLSTKYTGNAKEFMPPGAVFSMSPGQKETKAWTEQEASEILCLLIIRPEHCRPQV